MNEQEVAKVRIDGVEYALVDVDGLTIDEALVLYEYSGLTLDQLPDVEGLHPGVLATRLYITMSRQDPTLRPKEIKELIGGIDLMELITSLAEQMKDASPPAQAPENDSKPVSSETTSGATSTTLSEDHPALGEPADPTGSPPSDDSAPSAPIRLAG